MKRAAVPLCISALFFASSSRADALHGGVSFGTGVARDGWVNQPDPRAWPGGQLELGYGHWSALVAAGGRERQTSVGTSRGPTSADFRETLTVISATAHWRWKLGPLFFDVGAGPAISFDSTREPAGDRNPLGPTLWRTTCIGTCGELHAGGLPIDVELGVGLGF
jgi:hypothetical protein